MKPQWRRAVTVAAPAAAMLFAAAMLERSAALRGERAAQLEAALRAWHVSLERDMERIDSQRRAAEEHLQALSRELSGMQSRIVRLDALAARLVDRAELDREEFDFGSEPGIGGPEESIEGSGRDGHLEKLPAATHLLAEQVDDRWQQLRILEDLLEWRELSDAVRPEGRPVGSAYVSSGFGDRIDPFTGRTAVHAGIDFAGRRGIDVVAVAAGIVTWSGPRSGYGEMVEIDHGNQHVTRYAHNSRNLVDVGDVVTRGQAIAKLGSTGRATGPNLHFEVLQDGRAVNPLPYIE